METAKTGITMLLNTQPDRVWDYGDLADALNVGLPVIVEACRELEAEGVIEVAPDNETSL